MESVARKKRSQTGYLSTRAYFKCSSCGFGLVMSAKWARCVGKVICLNPDCNPVAKAIQGAAAGTPMQRQGKLTTDQLNNEDKADFDALTAEGMSKVGALQAIEQFHKDVAALPDYQLEEYQRSLTFNMGRRKAIKLAQSVFVSED